MKCEACGRSIERGVMLGDWEEGRGRWSCLRCALFDRGLVRRSARVSAVVGTLLIAVNQGDQILSGSFPLATAWWKLPLTYLVPYLVATYGAISNGYRPVPPEHGACTEEPVRTPVP